MGTERGVEGRGEGFGRRHALTTKREVYLETPWKKKGSSLREENGTSTVSVALKNRKKKHETTNGEGGSQGRKIWGKGNNRYEKEPGSGLKNGRDGKKEL